MHRIGTKFFFLKESGDWLNCGNTTEGNYTTTIYQKKRQKKQSRLIWAASHALSYKKNGFSNDRLSNKARSSKGCAILLFYEPSGWPNLLLLVTIAKNPTKVQKKKNNNYHHISPQGMTNSTQKKIYDFSGTLFIVDLLSTPHFQGDLQAQ